MAPTNPVTPGRVAHGAPRLVVEVHPHQDVAGEDLALDLLALAVLDLDDLLGRHLDLEDVVLHVEGLDAALEVGLHLVLVAGVGVHDVPVAELGAQLAAQRLDRVLVLDLALLGRGLLGCRRPRSASSGSAAAVSSAVWSGSTSLRTAGLVDLTPHGGLVVLGRLGLDLRVAGSKMLADSASANSAASASSHRAGARRSRCRFDRSSVRSSSARSLVGAISPVRPVRRSRRAHRPPPGKSRSVVGHGLSFLMYVSSHRWSGVGAQPNTSSTSFANPMSRPATIDTMITTKTITTIE